MQKGCYNYCLLHHGNNSVEYIRYKMVRFTLSTMVKSLILLVLSCISVIATAGGVSLPALFQSHMVLQRGQDIPVWGWAGQGETVTVEFRGKKYTATTDSNGRWQVNIPKQKAGGPYTMTINDQILTDIMVGDVWLCSGQSNVDITIERVYPQYAADIDAYSNEKIRLFQVRTKASVSVDKDVKVNVGWKSANKQNAWTFSALGYFLAQKIYKETGVPQGIIQSSLGGSPIQAWLAIDSLKNTEYYSNYLLYTDSAYVADQTKANNRANDVWFNTMNATDSGQVEGYVNPNYNDSGWNVYNQYDNRAWARYNGKAITGSIWLRQHVNVDKAHAGKPAKLLLGTLHDMDYTYVNGKQVGVTYYQYPPRRYKIPAGLLHEGDNTITVRVIVKSGMANFFKDKPHEIVFEDGSKVPLSLEWKMKTGSIMPEGPLGGKINTNNQASVLYNGMIYPLAPYAIKGVVWYQGESNTGKPLEYGDMLKKMIGNWRTIFNNPTLPFNIVQLAGYMDYSEKPQNSTWTQLREQQRIVARDDAYASITAAHDLGEASDIHPLRKREVAERCAMALLNGIQSPQPVKIEKRGEAMAVIMDQPLQDNDSTGDLEILVNGTWRNVKGKAHDKEIIINEVGDKVRYAWKSNPINATLVGKNKLPVVPFEL